MSGKLEVNGLLTTETLNSIQEYFFLKNILDCKDKQYNARFIRELLRDRKELREWRNKFISIKDNETYVQSLIEELNKYREEWKEGEVK